MNPYVFLVGCPRSGTTLLSRIANAHPLLAVVHETRWIARTWEQRRGLTPEGYVTDAFVERLVEPPSLEKLGLNADDVRRLHGARERLPLARFVTDLFDLYGQRHGKARVGDKSPGYVRYIPTLHALWPQARFVHIIRDGRDICLSVLDWRKGATSFATFQDDPITTTAIWWEWYVRLGRDGGAQIAPSLYRELRYEALVADQERECRDLCGYLGIPYEPQMLRFHAGRTRIKPGLSSKSSWLPVTAGLRNWRSQMPRDDLLRFEAAAGELLDELGYERAVASIPRASREHATGLRSRFVEQAIARQRPVPRAWTAGVPA